MSNTEKLATNSKRRLGVKWESEREKNERRPENKSFVGKVSMILVSFSVLFHFTSGGRVRNCLFFFLLLLRQALDSCIYHDYSCTLISFLDNNESKKRRNIEPKKKKRRQTAGQRNNKKKCAILRTIAIKMETFSFSLPKANYLV